MSVISYPIPLYQNLPIEPGYYQPRRYVIEDIDLGLNTTVITTTDHDYVVGQTVRLIIPSSFGCYQLNEKQGVVFSIPTSDSVVISIDSLRNVDPFVVSSDSTPAQILAIGDVNSGAINPHGRERNQTYIDGSFINISPG